jgi:hypothetical protein
LLQEEALDTVVRPEVVSDLVPVPELTGALAEDTAGSTLELLALRLPLNYPTLQALPEARMKPSFVVLIINNSQPKLMRIENVSQGH